MGLFVHAGGFPINGAEFVFELVLLFALDGFAVDSAPILRDVNHTAPLTLVLKRDFPVFKFGIGDLRVAGAPLDFARQLSVLIFQGHPALETKAAASSSSPSPPPSPPAPPPPPPPPPHRVHHRRRVRKRIPISTFRSGSRRRVLRSTDICG